MTKPDGKFLHRRAAVMAGLAGLLLAAGGGWLWQRTGQAKPPPQAQAVRVVMVMAARRDMPQEVQLVGTVYPNLSVAVKSRLDSQVTEVLFRDGGRVQRGDILFRLDDRSLQAERAQLAANLQRDTVQLNNAKAQYERSAQLMKQGFVTREKLGQDKTAYEAGSAAVAGTKAALDNIEVLLGHTVIHAPITGRTGTIAATAGNNVKTNDQPLVTINQVDPILVQFAVPQRHFDRLKAAMSAGQVQVQASRQEMAEPMNGALDYIDNNIDQSNGSFIARARFDNPDEKLWPGMFVSVRLTLDTIMGALVVPAPAIQGDEGSRFVFIADPATQKAVKRAVTILPQPGDQAIITGGLQEGEQVITDGLLRVMEGTALEIAAQPKPDNPSVPDKLLQ